MILGSSLNRVLAALRDLLCIDTHIVELKPLPRRGSQREFFRLKLENELTFILVIYDPQRVENTYYTNIAHFLKEIGIPVPSIILNLEKENLIVIEDLGEKDLYSFREMNWEKIKPIYEKVISSIVKLHAYPPSQFPYSRVKISEGFNEWLYRWEREYFIENFVNDIVSLEVRSPLLKELEKEFEKLTQELMRIPSCLIHRDLQAQNIMVKNNSIYLIDFQGMRLGNPFYDIGSLLFDPYVALPQKARDELLELYCKEQTQPISIQKARYAVTKASIQRLMQALGAFGFLSKKKGLHEFLTHIPRALENLYYLLSLDDQMKNLRELVTECALKHGLKL
ncbi:MAG: aminoglycoside phosphotransferase family protein [Deltaproteobacteria bacterium]|nr:aminoglycoside phosphotransferase family protein [Deltaproteobacteria bacterium]